MGMFRQRRGVFGIGVVLHLGAVEQPAEAVVDGKKGGDKENGGPYRQENQTRDGNDESQLEDTEHNVDGDAKEVSAGPRELGEVTRVGGCDGHNDVGEGPDEKEEVVDVKGHQSPWHVGVAVVYDGPVADLGAEEPRPVWAGHRWRLSPEPAQAKHGGESSDERDERGDVGNNQTHAW